MPKSPQHDSSDSASALFERLTHAVLLRQGAVIPVTPEEVEEYDHYFPVTDCEAPVPQTPSFLFSWERKDQAPRISAPAVIVPFSVDQGLMALAARSSAPISEESRRKLSRLMADSGDNAYGNSHK